MPTPTLSPSDLDAHVHARHGDPRSVLGYHEFARTGDTPICVVRVLEPDAVEIAAYFEDEAHGERHPLARLHDAGLFEGRVPYRRPLQPYRLAIRYRNGAEATKHDPYAFAPQLTDLDLHLFGEGNHHQIYLKLGAHPTERDGLEGTRFAVWAPNAARVSVVGDFNFWDGRRHLMQPHGGSGIWELFVPGVGPGALYKFEIASRAGHTFLKADPFGFRMQLRPQNASVVAELDIYEWQDHDWMSRRATLDTRTQPLAAYEVHPGTWRRAPDREPPYLTWDELGDQLIPYVVDLGYTHIELMGVAEHPFDGSWGYQVVGYFAPTARHGSPVDFMRFVDRCHAAGLGVIMDWVPAHFPKDAHGLAEFDGSALYEHADPRQGEHTEWGTKIFNYGRHEVRNFLVANALYWLEIFHIDGLRVDAVASMLYLDYSRQAGQWIPNRYGGRENLDAIEFLKQLNWAVSHYHPGAITIAEESTAFPAVTQPVHLGGLGFSFKWNMGWMNDTLRYFALDPLYRRYEHNLITFSFMYAFSEAYLLPISHDEVVHGKGSLLGRMPGDDWQKKAGARLLLGYMTAHPGKKLLFMGSEFGQWHEWRDYEALDWGLCDHPDHSRFRDYVRRLNELYRTLPELHATDTTAEGFRWIDVANHDQSVFAFLRQRVPGRGGAPVVCAFNATPVPRDHYLLGVPDSGRYRKLVDSDDVWFGGSGYSAQSVAEAHAEPWSGFPCRIAVTLPPLGMVMLQRED
jgi:1,4-alpha-glucan branching enzyme